VTVISIGDPTDSTGVPAAYFSFNGTGEMTGTHFIDEYGALFGPLALTGTTSVGVVRDALHDWAVQFAPPSQFSRLLPVVAETYDGVLNTGMVKRDDVWAAIANLSSGKVAEGGVGGGTGMIAFDYKGGIGTSSRKVVVGKQTYTMGALVQANFGGRKNLTITGIPVGEEMINVLPPIKIPLPATIQSGSIVVILVTDAPLDSRQLERVAKRGVLGMARAGSTGENLSGDLFLAASTANRVDFNNITPVISTTLPDAILNPLFEAAVQSTEEAIVNAVVAGQTMSGIGGTVFGIPHDPLHDVISRATAWRQR